MAGETIEKKKNQAVPPADANIKRVAQAICNSKNAASIIKMIALLTKE